MWPFETNKRRDVERQKNTELAIAIAQSSYSIHAIQMTMAAYHLMSSQAAMTGRVEAMQAEYEFYMSQLKAEQPIDYQI